MLKKIITTIILVTLSFHSFIVSALAFDIPQYQGLVNDYANVLEENEEQSIEIQLTNLAQEKLGIEIAVVTITSLNGEPIEDVSQQFFDTWQVGKAETDSGIIILIAVNDQQVRIQTGYGAEVFLTDAKSGRIIRDQMIPHLKENNYSQALISGINSVVDSSQSINQEELVNENKNNIVLDEVKEDPLRVGSVLIQIIIFIATVFTYLISFIGRSKSWWLGGVIGAVIGWIILSWNGVVWLGLIGLLFDYVLSKNYKRWKVGHKATSWRRTWGGFYSSGKSSGFKFGGGRSGGGGASGRW